jgi:PAT family beta-lactamase induction signal transducer AmpG
MPRQSMKSILLNPRIMAMFFLGFSSGLPLALTSSTLQAWFTEAGVNIVAIGALSLVGLPYVWKFLWAPIMDRFVPPRGGRRKGWIFVTQMGLCITLFLLALLDPKIEPLQMGLLAMAIAFFSASQDIAIDAYRTDVLHPEERGVGAATYIFAYRIALLVAGGLALVIAQYLGWRIAYQLMAVLLLLLLIATYFAPRPIETAALPTNILDTVTGSFGDLFKRDAVILLLLFAVFYKLGDAFAASLLSNFLLHGLGFSLAEIAVAYKTFGLAATLLGAFSGGILMIRLGLYRSLLYFGFAQAFSTLTFVLLALIGKHFFLMASTIFIESFCSGMGTAAFVAFLMSLCHPRYTATQYACLSALTAIGRVFLGPLAGVMVLHMGWASFYAWAFVFSFPGLIILWLIRNKVSFNAQTAEC